jgi:hypothetical protein
MVYYIGDDGGHFIKKDTPYKVFKYNKNFAK